MKPADWLAQIPLFAALPQVERERLAELMRSRQFASGELLMREGESDQHFYILLDGEAEVIKALGTPDERLLAIKQTGAVFGELSLFNPQGSHTASVRARTLANALEMQRQDFDELLRHRPALAYEMMRQISVRLDATENATILDLREKNRLLTQAYQELKAAQAQLIIKEKLEKELAIARQIQESILPDWVPSMPGFDIAAISIPAREVGGDYFDFIAMDQAHFGLVVGDACDKGIPAALFINLTNSLVHIEAPRNYSPEATLRQVNKHLIGMNRSNMFVTLLYGILDSSGDFNYCRAGHPHPVVLDDALRLVEPAQISGMPLGIVGEIALDAQSVTIPPGGLAVIHSDGLSEAPNPSGEQFGLTHLLAELPALRHLPARQICARLWERVKEYTGDQPQPDDFTLIVIKRERLPQKIE